MMRKNKGLINETVIILILFLPLIEPYGLEDLGKMGGGIWKYLHLFTMGLKGISYLTVFFACLKQISKWEFITWIFITYQGIILIMTILNEGASFSIISNLTNPMVLTMLVQYYIKNGNAKKFLKVIQIALEVIIIINLLTIILIPKGLYIDDRGWTDNWILGYRNLHLYYFLPYIAICGINEYLKNGKIGKRFYLMSGLIVFSAFMCKSTTALLAMTVLFVLIVLFEHRKLPRFFSVRNICIVSLVISILFVFFSFQNYFSDFIENVLGKSATFSNRTIIWEKASSEFLKNPIWGYGRISYKGLFAGTEIGHMHNMFLDILIQGGIILMSIFALIIISVSQKIEACKIAPMKNICMFVFSGYAVLFISEARRDTTMLFLYLSVCYYLPFLIKKYQIY